MHSPQILFALVATARGGFVGLEGVWDTPDDLGDVWHSLVVHRIDLAYSMKLNRADFGLWRGAETPCANRPIGWLRKTGGFAPLSGPHLLPHTRQWRRPAPRRWKSSPTVRRPPMSTFNWPHCPTASSRTDTVSPSQTPTQHNSPTNQNHPHHGSYTDPPRN